MQHGATSTLHPPPATMGPKPGNVGPLGVKVKETNHLGVWQAAWAGRQVVGVQPPYIINHSPALPLLEFSHKGTHGVRRQGSQKFQPLHSRTKKGWGWGFSLHVAGTVASHIII